MQDQRIELRGEDQTGRTVSVFIARRLYFYSDFYCLFYVGIVDNLLHFPLS